MSDATGRHGAAGVVKRELRRSWENAPEVTAYHGSAKAQAPTTTSTDDRVRRRTAHTSPGSATRPVSFRVAASPIAPPAARGERRTRAREHAMAPAARTS